MTYRVLSLCSGYGGLDLGVGMVLDTELVAYAEFDEDPAKIMSHWHPDVPNYRDITQIDWTELTDLGVDIITAGYPCQPFSLAGRRKGTDDQRHLWPYIAEAVRVLRPRLVFLENVPGHRSKGFGDVLGDLAAAGYDAGWTSVRASDVGAPHQRERVFILAADARRVDGDSGWRDGPGGPTFEGALDHAHGRHHGEAPADTDCEQVRDPEVSDAWRFGPAVVGGDGADAPDPEGVGLEASRLSFGAGPEGPVPSGGRPDPAPDRGPAPDSDRDGLEGRPERHGEPLGGLLPSQRMDADGRRVEWGDYEPAIARWELVTGTPVPYPVALGPRGGRRVSVEFIEWVMGVPGRISPAGLKMAAGQKAGGNGVVPLQAAAAFSQLALLLLAGVTE